MSELEVQPRVNSESISNAFEQELRGENDLALASRGTAGGASVDSRQADAATPTRPRLPKLRPTRPGYSDDPLMASDEDPEDSWLIPSPGPPSGRKQLDMSPPTEELGVRKKLKSGDPKVVEPVTQRRILTGKRPENGNSFGNKLPSSPSKSASRIPRVAQLSTSKNSRPSAEKSPRSPSASQGSKSSINSRFGGPKKPANSTSSEKPDSAASASFKGKGQSDKLKAAISGRRPVDPNRDVKAAPSRIPSRPGSAASVNSARTTMSQRPVAKKTAKPQPARSGTANGTGYAAATASSNRRVTASSPGSRRTSKAGSEAAAAPAELLTAISSPEEDLAEFAKPPQEENPDEPVVESPVDSGSQEPTEPDAANQRPLQLQSASTEAAADDGGLSQEPKEEPFGRIVSIPVRTEGASDQLVEPPAQTDEQAEKALDCPAGSGNIEALADVQQTDRGSHPEAKRPAKGKPVARPEWIDIVPPPQESAGEETDPISQPQGVSGEPLNSNAVAGASGNPEAMSKPKVAASGDAVPADKPLAEERPGVGRKKAADLPHDGYSKPDQPKQGCCGCVVM